MGRWRGGLVWIRGWGGGGCFERGVVSLLVVIVGDDMRRVSCAALHSRLRPGFLDSSTQARCCWLPHHCCLRSTTALHHRFTDECTTQPAPPTSSQIINHTPTPTPATRPNHHKNVLLPLQPPHNNHRPLQHPPPHPPQQRRRRRHRRRQPHLPRPPRLLHRESPPLPALATRRPQRPPRPAAIPSNPSARPGLLHQRRRAQPVPSRWGE